MKTLQQRYFLSTKSFALQESKILIKEKSVFHDKEWEARYNELGLDLVKIRSREGIGNAILFGGLFIVTAHMTFNAFSDGSDIKLAWLFVFFCFLWGTVFSWTLQQYFAAHFILRGGHKTLDFFINSPDEATVRAFIETVRSRTKQRLKEDLTHFDPDLTFEEQLSHLKYLKSIEVLTNHEFEIIREDLREKHLMKR